jgi:phosphoribosylformylglycinamidine cyclo-ligase
MPVAITYQDAGVNIAVGNEAVSRIKTHVKRTFSAHVMGGIGGFGAMFDLKAALVNYQHPIMVQSIDGVGTKTIVARMADRFDQLGHDLLSACSNDILVLGAKTLTMLDYIANDKLDPARIEVIVKGMSQACVQNEVSLVGGETAEMPDTYLPGEHDLVGIVTGVVEKSRIIDGSSVQPGDVVMGFASSGLHTNGFSLARKLLFEVAGYEIDQQIPQLGCSIADALLAPHINYARPVHAVLDAGVPVHAMAHITGGGLLENIPRVLPEGTAVEIDTHSWTVPPLFELLVKLGQLPLQERYRTLNMGIGYVAILPAGAVADFDAILNAFPAFQCQPIGRVVAGQQDVKLKE